MLALIPRGSAIGALRSSSEREGRASGELVRPNQLAGDVAYAYAP